MSAFRLFPDTAVEESREPGLGRLAKLFLWTGSLLFFVWAFADARFRDAEGFFKTEFCLPVAVSVALLILGSAIASRLQKCAFWLALALVGQAVALQLIDAGPRIHYQHYRPWGELLREGHPLLLLYLVAQAALVAAGLHRLWPAIRRWMARSFRAWQIVAAGLAFALSSATVSRDVRVYAAELVFAALLQMLSLANIVVMAAAVPEDALAVLKQKLERLFGRFAGTASGEPGGVDRFAVVAALWVTVLAGALNFFSYERHPHIPDEVVYLYQARYFAQGMLTMPAPPAAAAFDIDLMTYEPQRWYCPVPPGWPAVLALGVLLGAPWLVNPVLAGLNVLLAYLFLREIYDLRTARLSVLLLALSPWHVFMAMNFMTHTFTLICALLAAVSVARARRTGRAAWGWLGGIATGLLSWIRPLEGFAIASLVGLWAIGLGGRRLKASGIAGLVLGAIAAGALQLPYNKYLTGHPTVFPIMAYMDKYYGPKTNAYGFGPERGVGWPIDPYPGHSPRDAMVNANLNTSSINAELFGWSTGSLILVILLVFSGRLARSDYLMLAVIAVIFGVHFFYWFSGGPDFGARYWYLMLAPCVALSVRGLQFLAQTLETGTPAQAGRGDRVLAAVLSLLILAAVNYFPWRAIDKYHHYLFMRPDIRYLAKQYNFGKSLVLVRGQRHPDYGSAAVYNPIDLHAAVPVYAWDRSPEVRSQALRAYPDRPVWVVEGPSITRSGFKVVAGPLPPGQWSAQEPPEK